MTDSLDDFLEELQGSINADTREIYGEKGFRIWQDARFMGAMENPDGAAKVTGACGDTIEMFLKLDQDAKIMDASFLTDGCAASLICASLAAEMSIGRKADDLLEISGESILEQLPGFPDNEQHCAFLAAETLHNALGDCLKKKKNEVHRQT